MIHYLDSAAEQEKKVLTPEGFYEVKQGSGFSIEAIANIPKSAFLARRAILEADIYNYTYPPHPGTMRPAYDDVRKVFLNQVFYNGKVREEYIINRTLNLKIG